MLRWGQASRKEGVFKGENAVKNFSHALFFTSKVFLFLAFFFLLFLLFREALGLIDSFVLQQSREDVL